MATRAAPETPNLRARAATAAVAISHAVAIEGGISEHRTAAVSMKESSFRQDAVGRRGEIGLMGILPGKLARKLCGGLDLFDAVDNVRCGIRFLKFAEARCGSDPFDYLPAYNSGVCGRPREVSRYADRVLRIEARSWGAPGPRQRAAMLLADVRPAKVAER